MIKVHSYESMGTYDGPGLRLVVFLQGCPFRCLYCANPDTITFEGGTPTEVEEIVRMAVSQKPFFGRRGGITFSGVRNTALYMYGSYVSIENCVVICTGAVAFGDTYAGLLAGNKIGGVPENVRNNLVINLSGVELCMYNGGAVSAKTELANTTNNKRYTSYADYLAEKDSITQDDWAADFLAEYFAK